MINFDPSISGKADRNQKIAPIDSALIIKGLELMAEALKKAKDGDPRHKFNPFDPSLKKKIILPTSPLV